MGDYDKTLKDLGIAEFLRMPFDLDQLLLTLEKLASA